MKPLISACIVGRNEGEMIQGCLENIAPHVDEIVFVHDGECTDDTLRVVKKYTTNITRAAHVGASEPLRSIAYKKAKGEWILIIDADERLSKELIQQLPSLITEAYDAYSFLWPYFKDGKNVDKKCTRYKKVLYRKSKMYQVGVSHMLGDTYGMHKRVPLVLEHHSLSSGRGGILSDARKNVRRSKVSAHILLRPIREIPTFNCTLSMRNRFARKILFERNYPWIAIFVMPVYSFCFAYLYRRYFLSGLAGFRNAVNMAVYHFLLCYHIMKGKLY